MIRRARPRSRRTSHRARAVDGCAAATRSTPSASGVVDARPRAAPRRRPAARGLRRPPCRPSFASTAPFAHARGGARVRGLLQRAPRAARSGRRSRSARPPPARAPRAAAGRQDRRDAVERVREPRRRSHRRARFVAHLLAAVVVEAREPEQVAEHAQHLPRRARFAERLHHRVEALQVAVGVDEAAGGLGERRDRQQHVGVVRRHAPCTRRARSRIPPRPAPAPPGRGLAPSSSGSTFEQQVGLARRREHRGGVQPARAGDAAREVAADAVRRFAEEAEARAEQRRASACASACSCAARGCCWALLPRKMPTFLPEARLSAIARAASPTATDPASAAGTARPSPRPPLSRPAPASRAARPGARSPCAASLIARSSSGDVDHVDLLARASPPAGGGWR